MQWEILGTMSLTLAGNCVVFIYNCQTGPAILSACSRLTCNSRCRDFDIVLEMNRI
jgi:hypothetical protein